MTAMNARSPRISRLGACAFALAAAATAQAAPDAALYAAAQAQQPAVIASLKDMVLIESGSANAEGLAKMADYTEARLKALGATTERFKATRGPGWLVKGSFSGTGTKKLMLIAHMDTVYPANTLLTEPYKQDGNKLYGPGIADDKGGIAVILHSLAILKDAGWRDFARLTVLFNPDEEVGSGGSGETIAALADEHDFVFSCEPTAAKAVAKNEGLLLGASGTATATMEVKGRSSHAGAAPELGRNALIELAYQLQQTRDIAKGIPGAQLNWTTAQAGVVRNQIPEKATAGADVRTTRRALRKSCTLHCRRRSTRASSFPIPRRSSRWRSGGRPSQPTIARVRSRSAGRRSMPSSTAERSTSFPERAERPTPASPAVQARRSCWRVSAWPAGATTPATNTSRSIRSCRAST